MESYKGELGSEVELLLARIDNAEKAVAQAEADFNQATESDKEIWQNRLNQRNEVAQRLKAELDSLKPTV